MGEMFEIKGHQQASRGSVTLARSRLRAIGEKWYLELAAWGVLIDIQT